MSEKKKKAIYNNTNEKKEHRLFSFHQIERIVTIANIYISALVSSSSE
jgi:hypothetical protein